MCCWVLCIISHLKHQHTANHSETQNLVLKLKTYKRSWLRRSIRQLQYTKPTISERVRSSLCVRTDNHLKVNRLCFKYENELIEQRKCNYFQNVPIWFRWHFPRTIASSILSRVCHSGFLHKRRPFCLAYVSLYRTVGDLNILKWVVQLCTRLLFYPF